MRKQVQQTSEVDFIVGEDVASETIVVALTCIVVELGCTVEVETKDVVEFGSVVIVDLVDGEGEEVNTCLVV